MLLTMVHLARRADALLQARQRPEQLVWVGQGQRQGDGELADGLCHFRQAAVDPFPSTDQRQPVHHDRANQLGIDLTQDAPRILATPLVDLQIALPQLEQQLLH